MKRFVSLIFVLLLVFSLSACRLRGIIETIINSESSGTVSSTENNIDTPTESASRTEEVIVSPTMVGGENSVSVVFDEEVLIKFTLPTETPIYKSLQHSEGDEYAIMTHALTATSHSGRTIVEVFAGSCQDYADYVKSITSLSNTVKAETKDLDGKEVLICKEVKKEVNSFGRDIWFFKGLIAVPLNENITLGFRIVDTYPVDNEIPFDDSVIEILLSHCEF